MIIKDALKSELARSEDDRKTNTEGALQVLAFLEIEVENAKSKQYWDSGWITHYADKYADYQVKIKEANKNIHRIKYLLNCENM